VAYLTFPTLLGIAVLADELVAVLLGPAWHEAVLPLRALCLAEMVASIANLQSQLLISTGHVKRLLRYNLLCACVMPLAVAAGAWAGGLRGVALAWMSVYPLLALWLLNEALTVSKLRYRDFWHAVRQPLTGALTMAAGLLLLCLGLDSGLPGAAPLLRLVAGVAFGALVYLAYLVLIDREGVAEVRQVLADIGVPPAALARWPFVRGRRNEIDGRLP
jgi:O-antigen/teichoic acid export membrane protein